VRRNTQSTGTDFIYCRLAEGGAAMYRRSTRATAAFAGGPSYERASRRGWSNATARQLFDDISASAAKLRRGGRRRRCGTAVNPAAALISCDERELNVCPQNRDISP